MLCWSIEKCSSFQYYKAFNTSKSQPLSLKEIQASSVVGTTTSNRIRSGKAITEGIRVSVPCTIDLCLCCSPARLELLAVQITHLSQSLFTLVKDKRVEVVAQYGVSGASSGGIGLGLSRVGITSCCASGCREGRAIIVELPSKGGVVGRTIGGGRQDDAVAVVGG